MERADRQKAENETLKLVNELQESSRKVDGLRDMETKYDVLCLIAYCPALPRPPAMSRPLPCTML